MKNRLGAYAAATLGAYLVLVIVLPPERAAPIRALAAGAFAVALVGARCSLSVRPRPEHPEPEPRPDSGPPPEQFVRLARIETSLRFATESRKQYDRSTRPLLRELVTARLVAGHAIDPAERPAAARELMGEELWQLFAESPGGPPPDVAALDRLVRQVESL